jgi:hypothetical protein
MFQLNNSIKRLSEGYKCLAYPVLLEKNDFYINKDDFLFLFPRRSSGANIVVHRNGDKFDVLVNKSNMVIGTKILAICAENNLPKDRWISILVDTAEKTGVIKKFHESVSKKDVSILLLQKLGVSRHIIKQYAPDLVDTSDVEDFVNVGKIKIIGANAFKKSAPFIKAVEKAAKIIADSGYGQILYGDVFLVASSSGKANRLADYDVKDDVIRLVIKPRDNEESIIKTCIHEFGHRQYYKFNTDKKAVISKFSTEKNTGITYPIGTEFINDKNMKMMVVTGHGYDRNKFAYTAKYVGDDSNRMSYVSPNYMKTANIYKVPGGSASRSAFMVSSYALTDEREFFAEIFAYGLIDKNEELLSWLKSVT